MRAVDSLRSLSAVCLLTALGAPLAGAENGRPNVVIIMADDLGYETIGANGGASYRTPVLDRLAAGGARFEHCYVQPLCTPTRVQLMTGAYNVRNYTTFGSMDSGLATFANLFRDAGYATCIAGKWQLGRDPDLPEKFGFDEHCLWQHTRRPPRYANPGLEIDGAAMDYSDGEYGPDIINAYARDFIARHRDRPFLLYYPMLLTHSPYQPTPDSASWDPKALGEAVNHRPEHFGHMVEYMDKLIGRLVAALDEHGLLRSTLLIFIGDNGTGRGARSRMGDRTVAGGKGLTTAAGMHVPCIVHWPEAIPAGQVRSDLVDSTDFLPSICEAAGIGIPPSMAIDGRSFLPRLRGGAGSPREWIYSWYSPRGEPLREFVFDRSFKLYRTGEFFDLAADREENRPLRVADLDGEAAAAAARFRAVLARFDGARPANLPRPAEQEKTKTAGKKNRKKAETRKETAMSEADRAFAELARRYIDEFPALSPVSATGLGDHRFDDRLDEVSASARTRAAEFSRRYLAELERIPRSELSRAHQVDAELLAHRLRSGLWRLEVLREWEWNPLVYTGLAGGSIYGLMAREFAPLERRLASAASRLEELPRLLEQVRGALVAGRVPRVHAETAAKQNRGVLSILKNMVAPHLGALPPEERGRLERAMAAAGTAVETHQEWLEKELLPKAAGEFRIGPELYDQKLAFTLHSPLSRRDIRERAERELRRVREEMYGIAREIYAKEHPFTRFPEAPGEEYRQAIIRAGLEMAYREVPPRDRIVEEARASLEHLTAFVRDKDLITIPPDPVEIIVMPEFQRGVSLAYCDSPGPLDAGQKTFYAVAPLPEDWTEAQVRSFLREYNTRSLANLTVHEAMPGHFVQLVHSNRYPSTLRAVLSSGPFVEGWGVYAERLVMEQGYLDGDPLYRLVVLKWYLRGIANAILDQSVHAGDMTREEAMELMIEKTFQEEREAAAKWVRAQLTSAQLSTYFVGYQEHADLLQEVRESEGEAFRLKEYHDRLLSFGSPPVQFARALLLDLPIPGGGK